MKLLAALTCLGALAAMLSPRPETAVKRCDPYAEKCPACVDCTACKACNTERNRCSVCRDKPVSPSL